jgi:peptidyl-dipeptidase Dcp
MTTRGLLAAAALYDRYGFKLTQEIPSTAFGKPVIEQRYELNLSAKS